MTGPLSIERRGAVTVVTINRPDRGNSLSRATVSAFGELGKTVAGDPTVRAVIITGRGERVFCAGADLKERLGMSRQEVVEQLRAYRRELSWLEQPSCVSVAALNGAALGGGLELAMVCDLRVAHAHVTLGLPETSLGIIPGAGGTQRLPRLVGEARARELILLGRRLKAEEALAWGLLNHVLPSDVDLVEETLAWLGPVVTGAPIAQRAALQAILASRSPLADGLDRELSLYGPCLDSEDRAEALAAFAEKRQPVFRGK